MHSKIRYLSLCLNGFRQMFTCSKSATTSAFSFSSRRAKVTLLTFVLRAWKLTRKTFMFYLSTLAPTRRGLSAPRLNFIELYVFT